MLALKLTVWASLFAGAASAWLPSARTAWLSAAALLTVHSLLAFAQVHGWSHAAAYAATARQVGEVTGTASGAGLWVNYAFLALSWAAGLWWSVVPRRLQTAWWIVWFFIGFNGAVVFAAGQARLIGAVWALVAAVAFARHLRNPQPTAHPFSR